MGRARVSAPPASTLAALGDAPLAIDPEHQATGRDTGPGGDHHVFESRDLVDRRAADEPDALGDAVHAVEVSLSELPPVGIDGQASADLDTPAPDEVLGLPLGTE